MRKSGQWVLALLVIALVIGGVYFGVRTYIGRMYAPMDRNDTTPVTIEIPQGSSPGMIAMLLHEKHLIRNGSFFKNRVDDLEASGKFRSGTFTLSRSMSVDEIIGALTAEAKENAGPMVKLVVPEGFERRQIAQRIEEKGLGSAEKFMQVTASPAGFVAEFPILSNIPEGQSLEGYLFPATYDIAAGTTEEDIARKMLSAFTQRYSAHMEGKDLHGLTFHQMLTLASIIEREAVLDKERPLMSAVFYNRMRDGMPLQSCATVQYLLGERKAVLTVEDTKIDSPYNTYLIKGLPPGPIANPGLKSIEAAMQPADVPYLFFVRTGEDGSHTFSTTYEEHMEAKKKMIR